MKKPIIYVVIGCIALLAILAGIKFMQISTLIEVGKTMKAPPETVSSYQAKEVNWERTLSAVGTLEAVRGVTLSADIAGRVTEINFHAGAEVKKGDLLVRQDTSSEQAQLRAAEANVDLTRANLTRVQELHAKKLISKSQLDSAQAQARQAIAETDRIQSIIEKKSISAPFDGQLGIRLINLGEDLSAGTPIVSLQAADPIFVNFYLPQQYLAELKVGLEVRVTTDAAPGKKFVGKVSAINTEVEQSTRNVRVQSLLANPEHILLSGMFSSVEVVLAQTNKVIVIPATAVAYATYGDSVFVLEENKESQLIARQQFVQLGEARGDFVAVNKGVKAGETVASAGLFKIFNGAPVAINNEGAPEFRSDPSPEDQ
ncbi:efflux RND transporter periplasmic adaptor subunit [Pseudomonadota bacterium]